MTVLYTTHYMEEAQELSNRVGIVDHGELIALGTQAELTQVIGEHDSLRLHLDETADCETMTWHARYYYVVARTDRRLRGRKHGVR